MLRLLLTMLIIMLLCAERLSAQLLPTTALVRDAAPVPAVPDVWLLLDNGSTLTGELLEVGASIRVRVKGIESTIDSRRVVLSADSLAELAIIRYEMLRNSDQTLRWNWLEWCTTQRQFDTAGAILNDLAREPRVDTDLVKAWQIKLERLQLAEQRWKQTPTTNSSPPPSTNSQTSHSNTTVQTQPNNAPHSLSIPTTVDATPYQAPGQVLTPSPDAIEMFAGRVQHLLVQQCATAGCHDTRGQQEFRLERISSRELIPRAVTLRNLTQTLRLIDQHRPAESPLLLQAHRPHGGMTAAPLTNDEQAATKLLRDWIATVIARPLPAELSTPTETASSIPTFGIVEPMKATFGGPEMTSTNNTADSLGIPPEQAGWRNALAREKQLRDEEARQAAIFAESEARKATEAARQAELLGRANVPAATNTNAQPPQTAAPSKAVPPEISSQAPRLPAAPPKVIPTAPGDPFNESIFDAPRK